MGRLFSAIGRFIDGARNWIGRLLFLLVMVLLLLILFSGPATVTVPSQAALVWTPSGVLSEQVDSAVPADLLFGAGVPSNSLIPDLLDSLRLASTDPRITALVIDVSDLLAASPAQLEMLGDGLQQFRDSGKPVFAYGEYFTQAQYALVSYADEIDLHPMGSLMLTGFGGSQLFFRDLLDRLHINVSVFRAGEFKSAAEPYTRMDLSEEARGDNQRLVDNLWSRYLDRVATNRELSAAQLQAYADNFAELLESAGGNMARAAFEQGLIDNIASVNSFRRSVAAVAGADNGSFNQIHYLDYLLATNGSPVPAVDQVGVIVVQGTIMPGEQAPGMAGADSLVTLIRRAQADADIKAVVLRVDSPGGSALASEEIRAALTELQQAGKPLVVSMGGTAASGGYWISANADQIWASPSTITGSIGVIGVIPTFEDALAELGVGVDGVGTTALSRGGDPLSGLNETMRRILQANIDDTYERFLNLVADGRQLPRAEVEALAGGRVYSGEQALQLGLIDELGDLDQALASAAQLAGLDEYQRIYLQRPLGFGEQLLLQMLQGLGSSQVLAMLNLPELRSLDSLSLQSGLAAMPTAQRQQWRSVLSLLLPPNVDTGRLRALMICEQCLSVY
ncbi:signal peptide peptidase SppA [Pseudohongiella spirulinae]|uniref:Protease 4 n=1 Tax=Pseudohongiella spirulinae TaxID=1249552 RepID=A0A0S2K9T7_9GAMM|nr:signal peptide peptidase SppA [Pseudohongiella spirulinae]ALO45016.1 Protease 4 [Pseudohongiella spirulinae]